MNNMVKNNIGSIWRKWDLQVHTYLDPNWKWPFGYPEGSDKQEERIDKFNKDFIKHCIDSSIAVVAITDHNTGEAIDGLIQQNKIFGEKITILPGVEVISTEGVHLLIIFDTNVDLNNRWPTWKDTVDHFLTSIFTDRPRFENQNGRNTPANSPLSVDKIIEEAEKFFTLTIFPHVLSNSGIFNCDSRTRKRALKLCNILDITCDISNIYPQLKKIENKLKGQQFNSKNFAYICTSDSRKISDIGTRYTWIKAEPTFEGLKQIIYEPEERIYLGEENPNKFSYPIVSTIKINNCSKSFFFEENLEINLNPHLVTIIGSRGSGKSAFLDTLVLPLDKNEVLNRDNYIKDYLNKKEALDIQMNVQSSSDGNEKSLIFKDFSYGDTIKEFSFEYYSQKEIGQLADPKSKTDLSQLIFQKIFEKRATEEIKLIKKYNSDALSKLGENREQIQKIERVLKDEKSLRETLEENKKQIAFLQNKEIQYLLEKRRKFIQIQSEFKRIREKIEDEVKTTKESLKMFQEYHFNYLFLQTEQNKNLIPKEWVQFEKFQLPQLIKNILDRKEKLVYSLDTLVRQIEKYTNYFDHEEEIRKINEQIKEVIKEKNLSYSDKGVEDLQKKISAIETQLNMIEELKCQKQKLIDERKKIRENYFSNVDSIKKKLENTFAVFCNEEGKILNGRIQIDFYLSTKNEDCVEIIKKYHILNDSFSGNFPQEVLLWVIENKGLNEMIETLRVGNFDAWKEWENIGPQRVKYLNNIINKEEIAMALEEILPAISFGLKWQVAQAFKPLAECSIGERSTAVLSIILVSGTTPLIIDQLEDDLDHSYIFKPLTDIIKHVKKRRQLIFATHNANIVINGDAEQILIMEVEKGRRGKITISTIEDIEKRNKLLSILEGGREAFNKREKKYGPTNSRSED